MFTGASNSIEAKIVFTADGDIFVMNDDGSRRRRLTKSTTETHRYPRWSPDGRKIAFTRYMDKENMQYTSELCIMNADGTDPQQLTDNKVADGIPSWSPDGHHIAFRSGRSGGYHVHSIDVATLAVTQLTGINDNTRTSTAPDWSPDGTQIVFERFLKIGNGNVGITWKTIYVMDADGQNQRPVLPDPPRKGPPTYRFFPRWSTDGHRILFYEARWFPDRDVKRFCIKRIGGRKQELTAINDRLGENFIIAGASWMADDQAVLFSLKLMEKPEPNYDLYRYTLATRGLRKLQSEPSDEMWPDWIAGDLSVSPHGKLTTLWGALKNRP